MLFELAQIEFSARAFRDALLLEAGHQHASLGEALSFADKDEEENPQKWLTNALERIGDALRLANGRVKRLSAIPVSLTNLSEKEPQVNAAQVHLREARLNEKRAVLAQIRAQRDEAVRRHQQDEERHAAWEARKTALLSQLGEAEPLDYDELQAALSSLRLEKEALQSAYQSAYRLWRDAQESRTHLDAANQRKERAQTRIAELRAVHAGLPQLRAAVATAAEAVEAAQSALKAAGELKDRLTQARSGAGVQEKNIAVTRADIEKFNRATRCPTCLADGTDWRDRILAQLNQKLVEYQDAFAACNEVIEELAARVPQATQQATA
jgi:chromosome segregation ATPase